MFLDVYDANADLNILYLVADDSSVTPLLEPIVYPYRLERSGVIIPTLGGVYVISDLYTYEFYDDNGLCFYT